MDSCSPVKTWEERIADAIAVGGRVIAPNHLSIKCLRYDGAVMEHEHADHPDYKFPVVADFVGPVPRDLLDCDAYCPETHALIYTDGSVAVTVHECTYSTWLVSDGKCIGGQHGELDDWRLSEASRAAIVGSPAKQDVAAPCDPVPETLPTGGAR